MTQTPSPATQIDDAQDPMSRHPLEHEFGLFVADNPGYGGVQGFCWFSSAADAIQWLCHDLPVLFDDDTDSSALSRGLSKLLANQASLQDLPLDQVNALAEGSFELRWAGEFDDLVYGNKPFERNIQSDFHAMIFPDERGQGPEGTTHEDYVVHILNYHSS